MDSKLSQYLIPKNIDSSFRAPGMFDLKGLLECIHTSNDVNVQVKLFSTLSTYLISNAANIEEIITHNSLYDKVCNVLLNCPPRKASVILNFLTALVYTVEEHSRKESLIVYAKNMIRSSGCLAAMCDSFTNCMMHQDVWRSLCQCLAEACRNVEANQSYCTHLVPMCVQRCSQRNIEVLLVLQSLIQNHSRNAALFIECSGISLFQREFLQHDICLQLLNTLVQSSEQAIELINTTDVSQHLYDFLRLYGPQSQLGQWATIILYYMSGTKGTCDIPVLKQNTTDSKHIEKSNVNKPCLQNSTDTTTQFFQNVMNEIIRCGSKPQCDIKYLNSPLLEQPLSEQKSNLFIQLTSGHNELLTNKMWTHYTPQTFNNYNIQKRNLNSTGLYKGRQNKNTADLSFSFLYNKRYQNVTVTTNKITETFRSACSNPVKARTILELDESHGERDNFRGYETPELSSFEPKFVSTPKTNKHDTEPNKTKMRLVKNSTRGTNSTTIGKRRTERGNRSKKVLSKAVRIPKRLEQARIDKVNKHRTISGWFFETVNESCTTLVNTVKNIFKPKQNSKGSKSGAETPTSDNSAFCSYSFTNYMRKRDAVLKTEHTKKFNDDFDDFSTEMPNSCNTCNNTIILKQKLANDEFLKQTVRKLKLGINLYGCDFKKISKQLWPDQTYMTPVVLYNLYRKLVIK